MRYFWPIYLITTAVGTAGVYVAAPLARPYVPDALKGMMSAASVQQPLELETICEVATPSPVASVAQNADSDELFPAQHGIYLARRGEKPAWGITSQQTSYYLPGGTRVGHVEGGTLLEFRSTHTSSKGNMVECVLLGEDMAASPMLVKETDIRLFTGDYRKLSSNQLADLKMFYTLSGKIAQRKKELLQDSAQKNPHFTAYQTSYNALTKHTERAKELTVRRDNAMDAERMRIGETLREMKVAEIKLRKDYDELHQKFRAWKDQHAGELATAESDTSIKQWAQQQTDLAQRVPGLVF